ncbi:MAG TPA: IPT/TIG domain-containing protein, partial [Dehalococcoidia bacterium]|nr:IPT/TIG domain-containing protein [Dehalococcoidia bacterium]
LCTAEGQGAAFTAPRPKTKGVIMLRRFILALALLLSAVAGRPLAPALAQGAPPSPLEIGNAHIMPNRQMTARLTPAAVSNLTYNNGPVMHQPTVHVIYWLPAGLHFEAAATAASDSNYETLSNRFFAGLNGSPLYGLLTQYSDSSGSIENVVHFAGSWVDTTPYGHTGSTTDPLHDADIQAEVTRAIAANNWTAGKNVQFFVYTALNINSCYAATSPTDCTFPTTNPDGTPRGEYCAYHASFTSGGSSVIYSNMADVPAFCTVSGAAPNSDSTADSQISVTSHEFFESVTDPFINAWKDATGQEIGDKCAWVFGARDAGGADVLFWQDRPLVAQLARTVISGAGLPLAQDDGRFIVQKEWSNSSGGCQLQLPPTITSLSSTSGPDGGGGTLTIFGTGLLGVAGQMSFSFGPYAVTSIGACSTTECKVTIPSSLGGSPIRDFVGGCQSVDVIATVTGLRSSPATADLYQYQSPVRPCVGPIAEFAQ